LCVACAHIEMLHVAMCHMSLCFTLV
jgi:hypothetical protein